MPQDEQQVGQTRLSLTQSLCSRVGILLAGAILLGAIIRILLVLNASVWYDEAVSIYYAQQPLYALPSFLARDVGEPLFFTLLHGWMRLFGNGERATAMLPFLFSVANLYAIFLFGRKVFGDRVGLLSALLLSANTMALHNATNVRFYALLDLVATLSNLAFFASMENRKATKYFIVISVVGFYTHAYYYFVCFAQVVVMLLFYRPVIRRMVLPGIFVGLAYAPWFFSVFLKQLTANMGDVTLRVFSPPDALLVFGQSIWAKVVPLSFMALPGSILALCAIVGFLAYRLGQVLTHHPAKEETRRLTILLALYAIAIGSPIFISMFKPIYLPNRYDVIGLSALLVAVAFGIHKGLTIVKRPWVTVAVCVIIPVLSLPYVRWRLTDKLDGDRTAIQALRAEFTPDDVVLFAGHSSMASQYYMNQYHMGPKDIFYFPLELSPTSPIFWSLRYKGKEAQLAQDAETLVNKVLALNPGRVVLFDAPAANGLACMKEALDRRLTPCKEIKARQHPWGPLYRGIILYEGRPDAGNRFDLR